MVNICVALDHYTANIAKIVKFMSWYIDEENFGMDFYADEIDLVNFII